MKATREVRIGKLCLLLREKGGHIKREDLARHMRCSISTISADMMYLRKIKGVGVYGVRHGIILSQCATVQDDLEFLRRANGRRTMDVVTLHACRPDIEDRWGKIEFKHRLQALLAPLDGDGDALSRGADIIKTVSLRLANQENNKADSK